MTVADDAITQDVDERAADLVLARVHLRLGSLGLARAELEAMAGRNTLDDQGIRDLAEVRWRTGDLSGAGEAAAAYLAGQPDDAIALVIAAELQAHLGRPGEARRLAARALSTAELPIDRIFAGMPRSSVWPVESGAPAEPAGTLFAELTTPSSWALTSLEQPVEAGPADAELPASTADPDPHGPGLWEHHEDTVAPTLPDAVELVMRGRNALEADRPGQAAAALALALRAQPSLAPAILDMIIGRAEPVLSLVRGDAHRIVGHEAEALRDYAAAVAAIGLERRSDDAGRMDRHSDDAADRSAAPPTPAAGPKAAASKRAAAPKGAATPSKPAAARTPAAAEFAAAEAEAVELASAEAAADEPPTAEPGGL